MAIVSYTEKDLPQITEKDWARFDAMTDEDIDFSDIPRINSIEGLKVRERQSMYRPVKVTVNCMLDADIVAWLKSDGKEYQTRLNAILRQVMLQWKKNKLPPLDKKSRLQ